jgi:hypothetical protein
MNRPLAKVKQSQPGFSRPELTDENARIRTGYTANTVLWWSYDEAVHYSGLSKKYLYKLRSMGKIETRPRGAARVDRVSLERYLNGSV